MRSDARKRADNHAAHWDAGVRDIIARERAAATAELRAAIGDLVLRYEAAHMSPSGRTYVHVADDLRRILGEVKPS